LSGVCSYQGKANQKEDYHLLLNRKKLKKIKLRLHYTLPYVDVMMMMMMMMMIIIIIIIYIYIKKQLYSLITGLLESHSSTVVMIFT